MVQQEYVDNNKPAVSAVAREFEGYNVKPQVYNTYAQEGDYPQSHEQSDCRGEYPYEHSERYDTTDYSYSDRNPPSSESYFPPEQDRFEDCSSYQEKGKWNDAHDYSGRYHDAEYPLVGRYPGGNDPPRRYPPEPPLARDEYPPTELPSVREDRYSSTLSSGPPVSDRFPEEEYISDRDKYSHEVHDLPSREGTLLLRDHASKLLLCLYKFS